MPSSVAKFNIDFMGKRRLFGVVSASLVGLALIALIVWPGPNYGIDFAGGTDIIVKFNESVTDGELREVMENDLGLVGVSVQRFGSAGDNEWLIQTRDTSAILPETKEQISARISEAFGEDTRVEYSETAGDRFFVTIPLDSYDLEDAPMLGDILDPRVFSEQAETQAERIQQAIEGLGLGDSITEAFGNRADRRFMVRVQGLQSLVEDGLRSAFGEDYGSIQRVESVGPRVGAQLRNDGIKAILLALVGILIYIAFRFDLRYAPGAVAALAHDVMITLGILMLLGIEINLTIVAALLTIVGYSLNDTIVNFDRIRENIALAGDRFDLVELTNTALNECFSRTILTSTTTLIAVMCIFVVGGGLVQDFALSMIIGVIIGTYSSLYIAAPIFVATSGFMDAREAEREARLGLREKVASEV